MEENGVTQHSTREVRFFNTSILPWSGHLASNVTFGLEVSYNRNLTEEAAIICEKHQASMAVLHLHQHRRWILSTDGGVSHPQSAGVALLFQSLTSTNPIERVIINCGGVPCSYRTEASAVLFALDKLVLTRIKEKDKTLLIVTGSRSLLASLNEGPLGQTDYTEDQIWSRPIKLFLNG
ncbi:hypothetical protein LSM04_009139 [Trypanosoma melophagium]|uniref:uncharacterized protein n=1 Tax=Trypanosoma melophagium TaxID=715481 RepID=UPI00351A64E6|nr:hypothetical protein LSM04_009139 [Trypanosoma melophagium]